LALYMSREAADLAAHSQWPGMSAPGLAGCLLGMLGRYEAA
jgi:hypothetical protein